MILAPDGREQFAASVDHIGMPLEIRRTINHSKDLYHTLYLIQAPQMGTDGREHRKTDLPGRQFPCFDIELLADAPNDQAPVVVYGPMPGQVEVMAFDKIRLIHPHRRRGGWQA